MIKINVDYWFRMGVVTMAIIDATVLFLIAPNPLTLVMWFGASHIFAFFAYKFFCI